MDILFLGKRGGAHTQAAFYDLRRTGHCVTGCFGDWGDPFPEEALDWHGDLIVGFLGRWIVPDWLLARAKYAINFHPGPTAYPGIGCVNFALYEGADTYGCICHHMLPEVDSGRVIAKRTFPIKESDTVASVLDRTYDEMLSLFFDVMDGEKYTWDPDYSASEKWGVRHTRAELDALMHITPDMDEAEVARRIRATEYGKHRPFVTVGGRRFTLEEAVR